MNKCVYYLSANSRMSSTFLVDCGTDGGLACANVHFIFKISCTVDIMGIVNHQVKGATIDTLWGVVNNHKCPVIAICHKSVLFEMGSSIHSPGQLESYQNDVNDKFNRMGLLMDISFNVVSGPELYISLFTYTLMQNTGWDPLVMNKEHENDDPNDMGFWSVDVCPFLSDNGQLCAKMLGGEEFEDMNVLSAPIIKLRHDSDGRQNQVLYLI
jgi:hypothetical protein